ncbi:DUF1294 domain-containing protein [Massilia sp. RP-1-19]|uniref:DUF1294 domain-containing protein n=1 Tax=Massilia polaris TaxID=2728846 RepID=A0A848HNV2_9BURK|nr:DUF1294 domain-containing protein [Massilia polaris]NML62854.1 DUF1294 domain-containing protein [Massilia polaris]
MIDQAVPSLAAFYVCASLVCFAAYALDKRAARTGRRRTPERTLLLLGLAGGWPGALVAQRWLRHKSSKRAFQIRFWFTVILHFALAASLIMTARM